MVLRVESEICLVVEWKVGCERTCLPSDAAFDQEEGAPAAFDALLTRQVLSFSRTAT